ncbi:MAG: hypothetical protein L3K25_11365 [Gammaproteobacteria bacterium]|nr:hypothetical protein [Gammaproteobacteria bacterium]
MKTKIKRRLFALCISMLYVLAAGHPVLAEDIEVLVGPGGLVRMKPNVLFIMDTSSSMGWDVDATNENRLQNGPSRLSILQNVFKDLMENPSYQGINVALMRFSNNNNGGYFVSPMQELNSDTRENIIRASRNLGTDGQTPLSETLYEAALFWGGETVDYGHRTTDNTNVSGVSDNDSTHTRPKYISPISNSECQKNYTILLTDGGPAEDMLDNVRLNTNGQRTKAYQYIHDNTSCLKNDDGDCLDDIAKYLNTVDQSSNIPDTQTVQTYTIGFTSNQTLLQQTADAGGGTYTVADDKEELEEAFTSILRVITNANDSFSPPALAANTFNGISHINRLYYTLFEPAATPKWDGNVKPYELNDAYQLVDAVSRPVIGEDGMFLEQSRSFWSNTDDGANIVIGGANRRLPAKNDRNLYTYTGDYDDETGLIPDTPGISTFKNTLKNANSSNLTADMLDISITDDDDKEDSTRTNAEFTHVLDTIRSAKIGAPLHSQPVLVTYGGDNAEDADLTLFVATNDGFLHALDASPGKEGTEEGGKELFAFIPKELLPNLPKLAGKTGSMVYGLDGSISAWVKESDDSDSTIDANDGDHVYIYVGMRRGGNNYYALDVTNRTAPTLKWVIRGGPDNTPGFEELGQSWSKPTLASIKYGATTKKVLIFGGGYDKAQDDNPLNADGRDDNDDTIGRAIFIVDATTGERLWWAGPKDSDASLELEKMTHSIPSDIRLMDSNHDGHTDRLYVGDMRGQIFRIDLKSTLTDSTGVLLASLSGETEADNRRFYYPPDVVLTQRRGAPPYVSINIGSGYRAHPLNHLTIDDDDKPRVNDRFYSLRDLHVGLIPTDETITPISDGSNGSDENLFDATNSLVANSTDIDALAASTGWYITLGDGSGEKVLAPSITINGEILFTTYTPPEAVENSECGPPPGQGRLYRVSLFDATPTRSNEADPALEDRATLLTRTGIPPAPTAVFRENSDGKIKIVNCVGTECEGIDNPNPIQEIYWQDGT